MSSSIKDVARAAGVSVATVSHVINGTRFVSDETRRKVSVAIANLQYSPNILARKFKTGSHDTVGFIIPDIANGYFATLIEEVEDVLGASGFRLIVANSREQLGRELDSLRVLSSGVVDGFVVASTATDYADLQAVLPPAFPVVLIDRELRNPTVDTVTTDNSRAVYDGVSALIAQGHRRIGFMASVRHLSTTAERTHAYRAALRDHEVAVDDRLIVFMEHLTDPISPAASTLLEQRCSALVASNNVLTNKLLAFRESGGWAAEDIALLGYRDPAYGAYPRGHVAWLQEPIEEMGRLAAEAILRRIADPTIGARRTVLQADFSASSPTEASASHAQ